MIKYHVIRLLDFIETFDEKVFLELVKNFKISKDLDVQDFLINKSMIFDKENLCRTYLILNVGNIENKNTIAGYFTITCNKTIDLDEIQKKDKKLIFKNNYGIGKKFEGAFLIGQLGRSDLYSKEELPGDIIIAEAYLIILKLVKYGGGRVIMLECKKDLEKYYLDKGFTLCSEKTNSKGNEQLLFLRRTDKICVT